MKRDVLYVDDESDNLIVFEATFEDDFQISTAQSGAEALELLAERPFPVVVADQRMPQMTGVELFEVMRAKYPHIKRVMLTGYADMEAVLNSINLGQVYNFIKKPWERHVVFPVLLRAIEAYDLSISNMALTERLVSMDRCAVLGRSAARMAHEMGNQLCLLPLLELIEEEYADQPDLVQTASVAKRTYERLAELVNEVKAFVRSDPTHTALMPISLSEVVHELRDFLRFDRSLPTDRLAVHVTADPAIKGSKTKLQQVLINLLKNAADAIRDKVDGRIELLLETADGLAVLRVTDNGCGMTPEVAAQIWEPFYTTKGEHGTGLGLDIARSIVEMHAGTIDCVTSPGAGAKFTMRLPLLPAAKQSAARSIGAPLDLTGSWPLAGFGAAGLGAAGLGGIEQRS